MTRQTYNSPHDDLSRATAELFEGDYLISEDPHVRAIQLAQFCLLNDVVQKLGWQTHTSDWDWSAEITLRDGTSLDTDDRDVYGDTFWLATELDTGQRLKIDLNNSWTACTSEDPLSLTHFVVLVKEEGDDEAHEIAIPVETLHTIRVYPE